MDIDYCKFCNDELFSITNVKFKVGFICQIIIDVDNSGVLNSQYSNINVIHYDNYSYTVFIQHIYAMTFTRYSHDIYQDVIHMGYLLD